MKKVYFINKHPIIDYDLSSLLHGLKNRGFEIIPLEKLSHCPPPEHGICFAGDILETESYFQIHGIKWDHVPCYPKNCEPFLKRSIEKMPFADAVKKEGEYFIKPIGKTGFTPNVYNFPLNNYDMLSLLHVTENCPVYMSDPVCFEGEYRCFYNNNCIEDVRKYETHSFIDWREPLNVSFINDIAHSCLPFNKSYVFDVGILSNGEWALVEFNDGICVGSYGLDPDSYASMYLTRWNEIIADGVKPTPLGVGI